MAIVEDIPVQEPLATASYTGGVASIDDVPTTDVLVTDEVAPAEPAGPTLDDIMAMPNVAEFLDAAKLAEIASLAIDEYELDRASMTDWRKRMDKGLALARMDKTDKTYPFPNCANVKYPLVTTAALQFNAKAYPAIVPGGDIVQAKIYGQDPQGVKAARGQRVSEHMSYQLACKVDGWEESTDKLLTVLPTVGTIARKWWWDPAQKRIRMRMIDTGCFVVNDKVRSLSDTPRCTEELALYPNEIRERVRSGLFREIDYLPEDTKDTQASQQFIEQHRYLDLDEDGIDEPYIVTVHLNSQAVARIVADFRPQDIKREAGEPQMAVDPMTGRAVQVGEIPGAVTSIRRGSYFVDFHLLPSLDGGFWGTGFGLLLGDISDTINGIINLMLDAGHMASRGGGFIGSEFRIKGGAQQFRPGEWRMVQATGATIRDSIVPMTFPSADATLFQLLGLLVDAGREVASVKDILMGETGGKQMTATTTMALIEQGMAQFTAAYKRIYRSLREEFALIARINAENISPEEYNAFLDDPRGMHDPAADYNLDDMDIVPVADPSSVTKMQRIAKAQMLMEMAQTGQIDPQAAAMRVLEAGGFENVEELAPKPDPMQQQMQAMAMQMQLQLAQADLQLKRVSVEQALVDIEKTKTESLKNLSAAAAQEAGVRLDALKMGLEQMRMEIERSIAIAGSVGGMAGAPGNGSDPQGLGGMAGGPAINGDGGVLGGQPMAGNGAAGPVAGASPMPGYF